MWVCGCSYSKYTLCNVHSVYSVQFYSSWFLRCFLPQASELEQQLSAEQKQHQEALTAALSSHQVIHFVHPVVCAFMGIGVGYSYKLVLDSTHITDFQSCVRVNT